MKTLENDFTTYEFTDQELIQATLLNTIQRAFIQHQIGVLNLEKVNMKLDVNKVLDFAQNEAYIAGQLAAYQFLLTSDHQSAEVIKELQNEQINNARDTVKLGKYQTPPKPFDLNRV